MLHSWVILKLAFKQQKGHFITDDTCFVKLAEELDEGRKHFTYVLFVISGGVKGKQKGKIQKELHLFYEKFGFGGIYFHICYFFVVV